MSGAVTDIAGLRETLTPLFHAAGVSKALVFGSYARGTQTRRSDVDLLLIQQTDKKFFDRYDGLLESIGRFVRGVGVEVLIYSPEELAQIGHRPFIKTILQEGICIYES